jgi:hypothetical protein
MVRNTVFCFFFSTLIIQKPYETILLLKILIKVVFCTMPFDNSLSYHLENKIVYQKLLGENVWK